MSKNEKETDLNSLFGIDKETLDKSKDIRPILNLGELKVNDFVKVEFIENEPKKIETPNSKFGKTSRVILVKTLEDGLECSLFMSSKSLSLGIAKVWESNNKQLKGIKVLIKKSIVDYKEFGANNCYNVQQIEE